MCHAVSDASIVEFCAISQQVAGSAPSPSRTPTPFTASADAAQCLSVTSWNVAGLAEGEVDTFIAQVSDN